MSIPTTTKEYRLKKPEGYSYLEIEEGPVRNPKPNEVLIKVHAVSLQYRDLLLAKGIYPRGQKKDLLPCSDMAGEVLAVGEDVKSWRAGDRVCANFNVDHIAGDITEEARGTGLGGGLDGVLTQFKILPAHCLVRIPDHLSYEEASTLPCAAVTAYNALNGPVPVKAGDYVLVQGTGGVSIFALQFAIAAGAVVIATSSSDEKLAVAEKLGAKHLINYKKVPDWDEEVLKITNGRGVDHVIEIGGPGTIVKSAKSVCGAGWIHVVGLLTSQQADTSALPLQILIHSSFIRGILVGSRALFEQMNRLIATHQLKPVIDRVFSFEQAKEAYAHLESQQHVGKVVIKVSQ